MPVVDLSQMGLQGQQAFYDRALTAAQAGQTAADARKKDAEAEELEKLNKISQIAAGRLKSALERKPNSSVDGESLAEKLSSQAEPLEMVADTYLEFGAIEQATDISKAASEIRKRESDIENDKVLAQKRRLENIQLGAKIAATELGTACNQAEWDVGMRKLRDTGVIDDELMQQLEQQPFSPEVAAYFREKGISAEKEASLELQQLNLDSTERYRQVLASQAERRLELAQRAQDELRKHRENMEKVSGGKRATPGAPNKEAVDSVKRQLKTTVFKDVSTEVKGADGKVKGTVDFDAAADYVTSMAQQMVREDKSLSWEVAVTRAIMKADQAGAFQVEESETGNWIERKLGMGDKIKKGKFNAASLPKNKSQLKVGQTYRTSRGLAKWNGTAFEGEE